MKNFKKLFLSLILMFVGVLGVNAISYTAYEAGDKITVNVSDTNKIDFYIVEESNSENDNVTAITYNFIDENKYNYTSALSVVSDTSEVWENVNSVSLPSAKLLLNVNVDSENESFKESFTEPTWVSPKTSEFTEYWLSEVTYDGAHAVIWGMDTHSNSQFHLSTKEDTNEIYVKLLIDVDKKYIEGGVTMTPLEELNIYLQENLKYFSCFEEEVKDIDVTNDDDSLTVELTTDSQSYETKYAYKDGILTYSKKGTKYLDIDINDVILMYVRDKFNYNMSKFNNYIFRDDFDTLSLEKDGVEVVIGELYDAEELKSLEKELEEFWATLSEEEKKEREEDGLDEVFNPLMVTDLKIDIKNGLKNYDESKIPGYNVIKGGYQKYEVEKNEFLVFTINAEFELLDSVYVDNKLVDKKNYEAKSGSTVITLKKEYLDKLSNGEHILRVTFKDGDFAETKFNVIIKNASTGINLGYGILVLVVLISGIGYLLIRKQSKFPKHN